MAEAKLIPVIICFGMIFGFCHGRGLAVIGQVYIRPFTPYKLVIVNTGTQNIQLDLTLQKDDIELAHKFFQSKRGKMEQVSFEIGKLTEGNYKLMIDSVDSSFNFNDQVDLVYHNKTESIFVQLDKPLYKPGDMIRFRIIVVDIDLKPVTNTEIVNVTLFDGHNSVLMAWPNSKLNNGIYESSFQLASSPVLGTWNLKTNAGNSEILTKFEVQDYILPNFYINAIPNGVHIASEKQIKLNIMAAYTFGRPVEGNVTVDILFNSIESKKVDISKTLPIEGSIAVVFDYEHDFKIDNNQDYKNIFARISLRDFFSNKVESVNVTIPIYKNRYEITSLSDSEFIPGRRLNIKLLITDRLDMSFKGKIATIDIFEGGPEQRQLYFTEQPNSEGQISVEFDTLHNASSLEITKVTFESYTKYMEDIILPSQSRNKPHFRLSYDKNNIRIAPGQEVTFEIIKTEKIYVFFYVLVSRGRIIDYGMMKYSPTFKYKLPKNIAPKAKFIVMYMNKYVIFNTLDLISDEFDGNIKLSLDPSPSGTYKPG